MRYNGHKNYETFQCHIEILKDFVLQDQDLKNGVSLVSNKLRSFAIKNLPMYDHQVESETITNSIMINWLNKVDFDGLAKLYMKMYR